MLFISGRKLKKIKYFLLITVTITILIGISKYKNEILKLFYPIKYSEYVYKYSTQYDLDPFLVFSIIRVESNFNSQAQSKKGAKGLMQITDKTGEWAAKEIGVNNYTSDMLFDPKYNIMFGCWYFNNLIKQFNGNIVLALAAYNGGSGNVEKWLKNKEYSSTGEYLDKIPFGETERYIIKVQKDYNVYKNLYGK